MTPVGVAHYIVLSAALLAVGLYLMTARRNAIGILMGVELVLNAANLNFVAAARHMHIPLTGHATGLVVIVLAAAEAAVALACIMALYSARRTADVDRATELRS
jgi:NADH-quinone oxidoreductase subunit K